MRWRTLLSVWCITTIVILGVVVNISETASRSSETRLAEAVVENAKESELAVRLLHHQWESMLLRVQSFHRLASELANAIPIWDSDAVLQGGSTALGRMRELQSALEIYDPAKFAQVTLVNAEGVAVWASTSVRAIRIDVSDREHIRAVLHEGRRAYLGRPVLGRASGKMTIQFTDPMHDQFGRLVGVSVVSVRAQSVQDFLVDMRLGARDFIAIIRDDGVVVASSDDGITGSVLDATTLAELLVVQKGKPHIFHLRPSRQSLVHTFRAPGHGHFVAVMVDYDDVVAAAKELNTQGMRYSFALQSGVVLIGIVFALACLVLLYVWALVQAKRSVELAMSADREFVIAARVGPGVLYRIAFDGTDGPVIVMISDAVERITGYTSSQVKRKEIFATIFDARTRSVLRKAAVSCRDGQTTSLEFRLRTRAGTSIWVQNIMQPYADSKGAHGIIGYLLDISVAKEQTHMMNQVGKLAALGQMATGIAHELNLPIATIAIAADNLRHEIEALPDCQARRVRQSAERITNQVGRATRLMEHLRVYGRTDDGSRGPIELQEAVNGALLLVDFRIRASRVRTNTRIPPGFPCIAGNQILLEQVLVNLFTNSIDAYHSGETDNCVIEISAAALGHVVKICVTDRAGGILAGDLERIYEPFYSTKPPGKGTGLGLSFSRRIVSEMGGTIVAESQGDGTVFVLVLPVFGATAPPLSDAASFLPAGGDRERSKVADRIS